MKRLTTDKPETNLESALNMSYAKDGEALVRGGGEEPEYKDFTLFDYIRAAIRNTSDENVSGVSNEDLAEVFYESWLFDGNTTTEGLIATLYTAAWAFAEIRERLKLYEDREQNQKPDSFELPCRIGDRVWAIRNYKGFLNPKEGIVSQMFFSDNMDLVICVKFEARGLWGKTVFATKEEAQAEIARRKGHGNG